MTELPPFYITQTLLGFGGDQDTNCIFLNLPDGSQFVLCEMGEPRTEQQLKRWRKLVKALTQQWALK